MVPEQVARTKWPFGSFTVIGLTCLWEWKLCKEHVTWSVAPESNIQGPEKEVKEDGIPELIGVLTVHDEIEAICLVCRGILFGCGELS